MRRRYVTLSDEQEQELRHCRDHHELPYMRLKAAAILKVATGQTIKQVARESGFASVQYMTRVFRSATGETPARYRNHRAK